MPRAPCVEVERMAPGRVGVGIKASQDREAGALEAERQPAATGEKIEDAWYAALLQPRDLGPDIGISRQSEAARFHACGLPSLRVQVDNMPDQPAHGKVPSRSSLHNLPI